MKIQALVILLFVCQPGFGAERMTLSSLSSQAKKYGKIVLLDFTTPSCPACVLMGETTWRDKRVLAWKDEYACPAKVDGSRSGELTQLFRIEGFPTIILQTHDGVELARLVGYRDASQFLSEANGALDRQRDVPPAKSYIKARKKTDPWSRAYYAHCLFRCGKSKSALKHYMWCFDHGLDHDADFAEDRLSRLVKEIRLLGGVYPPALDALRERREQAAKTLLESDMTELSPKKKSGVFGFLKARRDPMVELATDHAVIATLLEENHLNLALYEKLKDRGKDYETARRAVMPAVYELLLRDKRYEDIFNDMEDITQRFDQQVQAFERIASSSGESDDRASGPQVEDMKTMVLNEAAKYYEVLLGAGEKEKAKTLAEKLISSRNKAWAYAKLITHAVRAEDYETAATLRDQAVKTFPEDQLDSVTFAASKIPSPPSEFGLILPVLSGAVVFGLIAGAIILGVRRRKNTRTPLAPNQLSA